MQDVLGTLGGIALVLLAMVGLLAGWLASRMAGGRDIARYMAVGVASAMLAPFALAAIGLGALVAGGLLLTLLVALVVAGIVLLVVRPLMS